MTGSFRVQYIIRMNCVPFKIIGHQMTREKLVQGRYQMVLHREEGQWRLACVFVTVCVYNCRQ